MKRLLLALFLIPTIAFSQVRIEKTLTKKEVDKVKTAIAKGQEIQFGVKIPAIAPVSTATPTKTPTQTATATNTATFTATATHTTTFTPTFTATATSTPTVTPSFTPTSTATPILPASPVIDPGKFEFIDLLRSGGELQIFSEYSATDKGALNKAIYNPNCWAFPLDIWKITPHDTYPSAAGSSGSFGRSIAITPVHLLVTQHGTEVEFNHQYWALPSGEIISRWTTDAIGSIAGSFKVLRLDRPLPDEFVVPILKPEQVGNLTNPPVPVLIVNQFREALVHEIRSDIRTSYIELGRPGQAIKAEFFKRLIGNDSGSPIFLVYGKELVYLGNATTANIYDIIRPPWAAGPSAVLFHEEILGAVKELNRRHGGDYLPRYIGG